jgi:hypothetical protein
VALAMKNNVARKYLFIVTFSYSHLAASACMTQL